MRLLFDQNLSFRLVERLKDLYPDAKHVRDVRYPLAPRSPTRPILRFDVHAGRQGVIVAEIVNGKLRDNHRFFQKSQR